MAHVELFEVRAGADVKPGLADLLAAYSSIGPSDVDLLERRRHKPLPRLGLAVVTVEPVESSTSWLLKVAGA